MTTNSIIIRGDTTLLNVRTRDGNCLSEAASPIIVIMSCNTDWLLYFAVAQQSCQVAIICYPGSISFA